MPVDLDALRKTTATALSTHQPERFWTDIHSLIQELTAARAVVHATRIFGHYQDLSGAINYALANYDAANGKAGE